MGSSDANDCVHIQRSRWAESEVLRFFGGAQWVKDADHAARQRGDELDDDRPWEYMWKSVVLG